MDRLFSGGDVPDPVHISLDYLSICKQFPDIAPLKTIQTHVRRFVELQWLADLNAHHLST